VNLSLHLKDGTKEENITLIQKLFLQF